MNEMYFDWGAPMDAGRNDPVIGVSEWGTPVYRSSLGHTYWREKPRPKPERKMGLWEMLPAYTGELETTRKAPDGVSQPSVKDAAALAGGWLLGGLDVPRRALAGEPVRRGDVMATALDAGMMAAPMPAPKGALRAGGMADDAPKGIKAYHGSPHDFDRFSMDKIGTGEGAQAYGHGLYFAEAEDVAQSYKQALSRNPEELVKVAQAAGFDGDAAEMLAHQFASGFGGKKFDDWLEGISGAVDDPMLSERVRAAAREISDRSVEASDAYTSMKRAGRMYEVNINANPDDFLDWDAPLSQQSDKVRGVYGDFAARNPEYVDPKVAGGQYENPTGRDFLGAYGEFVPHDNNDMFNYRRKFTDDLREAGIPGIKYLDAGSRGAGTGTRNYVVFDENLISILRKYGIGAMVPGAGYMLNDDEYSSVERMQ